MFQKSYEFGKDEKCVKSAKVKRNVQCDEFTHVPVNRKRKKIVALTFPVP